MTKASDNQFPKVIMQEAANDGSDFSNPAADYRVVFLGEDGLLHAKDSAGTVTGLGGSGVADQGTVTYFDFTTAAAPASPAAGKIRVYSKTGDTLAQKDSGGTETVFGAGGGGGAPTTAEYVTSASDGTLSAEVNIPGLAGSVDIKAGGGSDDEFDASGLSGWTSFGTPTTADSDTTRLSHLYLKKAAASGAHAAGVYKANPTMPFTMTAKLSAMGMYGDFNMAGIFVGVADPSSGAFKAILFQMDATTVVLSRPSVIAFTNPTTYNGGGTNGRPFNGAPIYLQIVATSSSNVTFSWSPSGRFFLPIVSANNPGFTIGSVGLLVNPDSASNAAEADFDWIRFV